MQNTTPKMEIVGAVYFNLNIWDAERATPFNSELLKNDYDTFMGLFVLTLFAWEGVWRICGKKPEPKHSI